MLRAIELNGKSIIFEDVENGDKYRFTYISPVTNKETIYCQKGWQEFKSNLEKKGTLLILD